MTDPQITDTLVKTSAEGFDKIYTSLREITPQAWELAVKQQITTSYVSLIYCVVFITLIELLRRNAISFCKKYAEAELDFAQIKLFLNIIFALVCALAAYEAAQDIKVLLNPEYYAVVDFIKVLNK
jgi:amino acid permease